MAAINYFDLGTINAGWPTTTPSFTNQVFSATTTKLGVGFQAISAEPITSLGFRYGVRALTPPTYRISLQGVDSSGLPDGTIKSSAGAFATFTPPADTSWDGLFKWQALGSSYTPSAGEFLAWVLDYSSGTVDASNNSSFTRSVGNVGTGRFGTPYTLANTGSWAKSGTTFPIWGYRGATSTYGFPLQGVSATAVSVDGNRAAMRFTLPSGAGTSIAVSGLRIGLTTPTAGGQNWVVGIWDSTGTVVQSVTIDSDFLGSGNLAFGAAEAWFATPAVLNDGTVYYAGVQRSGTNLSLTTYDCANAGDLAAFWGGTDLQLATWNGSAWTAVTTSRPLVELILSDMTATGGGATVGTFFEA